LIYIKLIEKKEMIDTRNDFLKFIEKMRDKFIKLKEEKIDNKTLIVIKDTEKHTLNKLSGYIKRNCVNRACLSNNLLNNKEFISFIKSANVKIFDGKWLFKHLALSSAEYVCKCKKESLAYQEVTFLTNGISDTIVENIKDISGKVKILNIITEDEKKFRKIEKELYEEKGIILNMNNNYKKSLIKSDIIFNFDFSEEEINMYTLPKKTCIINLNEGIKINTKSFEGINAEFFEIPMPRKYLKDSIHLNDFDNSILYESYIYKNTSSKNIMSEIAKDGINISFLNGKNGRIRKNEYLNLSKKIAN